MITGLGDERNASAGRRITPDKVHSNYGPAVNCGSRNWGTFEAPSRTLPGTSGERIASSFVIPTSPRTEPQKKSRWHPSAAGISQVCVHRLRALSLVSPVAARYLLVTDRMDVAASSSASACPPLFDQDPCMLSNSPVLPHLQIPSSAPLCSHLPEHVYACALAAHWRCHPPLGQGTHIL